MGAGGEEEEEEEGGEATAVAQTEDTTARDRWDSPACVTTTVPSSTGREYS